MQRAISERRATGQGRPADFPNMDPEPYRLALRGLTNTVFVVTSDVGGTWRGITATAVSSLSFEPPSLLVCINRNSSFYAAIACAERFCVNALRDDQQAIADQFGSSTLASERFQSGDWAVLNGLPALASAQTNLVCAKVRQEDFGTHAIFIGQVEHVRCAADARPLIYGDGRYGSGARHSGP